MSLPASCDSSFVIRPLTHADLGGLAQVQLACYGSDYVESTEVFARRLSCAANCSLAVERGGRVLAYLAAYRSLLSKVTPMHGDFEAVARPDTLYLHDMAVHPEAAGQGLARALLGPLMEKARAQGLLHTALVSVQGSQGYWERHGYQVQALGDAAQLRHLHSYGEHALYMSKGL
ncbi:GNAT family N-acetyltransferase [Comamonas composti]|uniref:GNAT family N-acetyltransferase n=1 Tax=Comamonas composti TaxID=408558 RepID=UPI000418A242|nr:GNAT family N-acetyltransferase [Comamonas composti]